MKTFPTYPTRHPNWIDVDPEPDCEKWWARIAGGGITFKFAFVIVLGFHVILLGGIYASSGLKSKAREVGAVVEKPIVPPGPKSDALARNAWPQPEATPEVKALPPVPKKVVSRSVSTAPKVAQRKPPAPQATPGTPPRPPAPPVPRGNDLALREEFLAARNANPSVKASGGLRESVPAPQAAQPAAAALAPVTLAAKSEIVQPPAPVVPMVKEYTLGGGDNLYAVSRRLQVSYSDLMEANGITDPRQLRVGQKIKVPERKTDSTRTL